MFKNRQAAGLQLADALQNYKAENPVILAIPRGGVEVAYYIALGLKCDFSVLISHKLGFPDHPEAAFGALAEDGSLFFNPRAQGFLSREIIESVIKKAEKEIDRRIARYRDDRPLPSLEGRTVILVDDGIATGSTLFAAIELCKKQKAGQIVVAAPVSDRSMLKQLADIVDDAVILETPDSFHAVSRGYEEFANLTNNKVMRYLEAYNKEFDTESTPE